MNTLLKLQNYAGGRKIFLPLSLFLSAISSLTGMLPYIFIWFIIKELFHIEGDYSQVGITTYAWWAVGTAVGSVVLYFTALTLSHLVAFRVETTMRWRAMQKIVRMPLGFFDNNSSGRIRKIIDDNASITHTFLAHQLPDLAGSVLMPLTAIVLIFVFDWRLGLACLVPIIIAMALMSFMMGNKGKKFMENYMTSLEDMNTEAVEYVRGIPVVKVFQQTVFSFKNFHNSIISYKQMVFEYTKTWENPMSVTTVVINGFVFFLVPVAVLLIGYSGNYALVLLNLFLYILLTPVFSQGIMKSMYMNQALGQAKEAVNRMESLINAEPLQSSVNPKSITKYDICFKNVSFSYPGAANKAVDSVSFTIPEGKTIALVGASGSGKTTIARLVPRFWDADTGQVCIGGTDVKEIDHKELMNHVSFVFQNTKLFKTSLLDNIKYGNPDVSVKAVERAVDLAQCREIINKLSNGLDTKIGVEGTYLSGGEQQRIVLARAILKDAPIVVLDEATAFTDPENEHLIQKALGKLTKGKTVLLIAHRLTSVMDADIILVIDESKIAEQGSHHELLNKEGIYSKMWNEYQQSIKWTIGKETQYV
ncbi:ABC transporter ATP-binding protein [Labilibaculum euxinus]|uniref:ATP-binding cassette domain-containing protein n=1 Tax=Labilibaculum euxinus TaxID=2686357 RepID=A0A7M4D5L9_9BACT|nr:ABC transporter ATP-binding protein [Labilibaculum euxinus]MUP37948.1 ATP-binding cassette domain-containing protein [Labilibaculum euxinus]MVB07153.1 ATP-binding cassette domain-containing protein [Labilibaculum euxinus]